MKIDTDRMPKGEAVGNRLTQGKRTGMPWLVILDGAGQELVTSTGPNGNIGCPVTEEEAAWFFQMLAKTKRRLTDEDFAVLRAEHDEFAEPMRRRR